MFVATWNGKNSGFTSFKANVEGCLRQVGAGYLTEASFLSYYKHCMDKDDYLSSYAFFEFHETSSPQAKYDRTYLYGILVTATATASHRIVNKHERSGDGILAWHEIKKEYAYDGSSELKLEQLEASLATPYNNHDLGDIVDNLDNFQANMAQVDTLAPEDCTDRKKKRILLQNIRSAHEIFHLLTICRDNKAWTLKMHSVSKNTCCWTGQNK